MSPEEIPAEVVAAAKQADHEEGVRDGRTYFEVAEHQVRRLIAGAVAAKRSALSRVPAENCCPAEVTTFLGLKLECEFTPGHTGMHLDIDQGIWWMHRDESAADPIAGERERLYAELGNDHYVIFTEDGWTTEHSVECRLSGRMSGCEYHTAMARVIGRGAPVAGRWRITGISEGLPDLERADPEADDA